MSRRRSHYVFTDRPVRHPVRHFFAVVVLLVVSLTIVIGAVNYGLSHMIRYERLTITVSDLPADLENWTILHFSDLHGMRFGANQAGISSAIGSVSVSSIVFTGDMIGKDGDVTPLLELGALLPEGKPKLYLPGDEDPSYLDSTAHSSLSAKAAWAEELEAAGFTILDEPVLYTRGTKDQARIWFIPADLYTLDLDAMERTYQSQLDSLTAKLALTADEAAERRVAEYQLARIGRIRESINEIKSTDIQIAVSHIPVTSTEMNGATAHDSRSTVFSLRQADLILAGHYCGGQFRIPFVGAPYVPGLGSWPDDSLIQGLSWLGGVPQYISPGLGASSIYEWWQSFRFMNQPVVTRLALTSKVQ